jgi:PIN domain nuclease of toxin-antitoxin system
VKILTDTHVLVWALEGSDRLSKDARAAMEKADVTASAANLWELCIKSGKKGALVTDPLAWWQKYVVRAGIQTLSIRLSDVIALGSLPDIHKDPFDRILVAQCVSEGIPLITKDARLSRYGIPTVW